MPAAIPLSDLVRRTRHTADMPTGSEEVYEDASDPRFASTSRIVEALNRCLGQLYNALQIARGEGRFTVESTIALEVGITDYNLPADFVELEAIMAFDGGQDYRDLSPFQPREEWLLRQANAAGVTHIYAYQYRLVNTVADGESFPRERLRLLPTPQNASHQIWLRYVPSFTLLRLGTDEFNGVNGWENWAVYGAAAELQDQERNHEAAAGNRQAQALLGQQIDTLAEQRDGAEPPQVQDVMGDHAGHSRGRGRYGNGPGGMV